MRLYLVTVEGTQKFDKTWQIAPLVSLRSLIKRGPNLLMPMAGDEVELELPDGQVVLARVESFGVEAWRDSEGNFHTNMDPSDPYLTLTIACDADLDEIPPGTEIWQSNARPSPASDAT